MLAQSRKPNNATDVCNAALAAFIRVDDARDDNNDDDNDDGSHCLLHFSTNTYY